MSDIIVSELFIYPVKSCAGFSLDSMDMDRFGPTGDRRWMVVDENGMAITQRDQPRLALVKALLTPQANLNLHLDDDAIEIPIPNVASPSINVQVWNDKVSAVDGGDAVAHWLTGHLGVTCRLAYMPDGSIRRVDSNYAKSNETVGFADAFPLLLISQASLDELNSRLDSPVPMNRFRPNLVVSGCEPFAEDTWKKIRIGEMEFDIVKPCDRCVMPSINQETAEKDKAITRVLAGFRRWDGKIWFGQNLLYRGEGALDVSAPVTVLE